jgi:hypothetical protein
MKKIKLEDLDLTKVFSAPKSRKQRLEEIASAKKIQEEVAIKENKEDTPIVKKIEKSVGPEMLACGHWNWYSQIEHEEARIQKKCCPGAGINGNPRFIPYLKRED